MRVLKYLEKICLKSHDFNRYAVAHEKSTKFNNLPFKLVLSLIKCMTTNLYHKDFFIVCTLPDQNRFSNKEIILDNVNISMCDAFQFLMVP